MSKETTDTRERNLRQILIDRRHEIEADIRTCMQKARADRNDEKFDPIGHSDATMQEGVGFALLQMKSETLARLDEALARLDAGHFGFCFECDSEISDTRLRALPFAVRCRECEEQRERGHVRERQLAQKRTSLSLFSDALRS